MRSRRSGWLLLCLLAGCGTAVVSGPGADGGSDAGPGIDGAVDDAQGDSLPGACARQSDCTAPKACFARACGTAPTCQSIDPVDQAVCACNGVTYANTEAAFAAGQVSYTLGRCDDAGPRDGSLPDVSAGDTGGDTGADTSADGAPLDGAPPAFDADAADAAVPSGEARIRLAHLAPDVAASDFCVAPMGGAFVGPHMASVGVAAGVRYPSASEYVKVASGSRYAVRLVAAGAVDCATPLAGVSDVTTTAILNDKDAVTIAAVGEVAVGAPHPLALHALVDTTTSGPAQTMTVRVFHAAPDLGTVDFGASSALLYAPQLVGLTFGTAPTAANVAVGGAAVDPNGYFNTPRWRGIFSVRQGGSDLAKLRPDTWPLVAAFLVGKVGSPTTPLGVLACRDSFAGANHLSNCLVELGAPAVAPVRIVNVSPDSPAIDFCVKESEDAVFPSTPILRAAGEAAGVPYRSASAYFALPAVPGDVRIIAASAVSDCTQPAMASSAWGINGPTPFTSSAVHQRAFGAAPVYGTMEFWPTNQPTPGMANFRFRHVIPGDSSVDVFGTPAAGAAVKWFANRGPNRVGTDYVATAPGAYQIRLNLVSSASVLLTVPGVPLTAADAVTGYLYASAPGTRKLLRCVDTQPAAGIYTVGCTD